METNVNDTLETKAYPAALGYRMPGEWEKHRATWLAWPHEEEPRFDDRHALEQLWLEMVCILSQGERVVILVDDQVNEEKVHRYIHKSEAHGPNIEIRRMDTSEIWLRDTGPIFIKSDSKSAKPLAATHWIFNAWGNKYEVASEDNELSVRIAALRKIPRFPVGMVLEGGSVDSNGQGTCLTTEQCLLNPNRNPSLSKSDIENYLRDYLGFSHFIWLSHGMPYDDTDGHVDTAARFVDVSTVVCSVVDDEKHPHYELFQKNLNRLKGSTDQAGKSLTVVPIPLPERVYQNKKGESLPANYANFYIANKAVLVPVYDDPNDEKALGVLKTLFPGRDVVGIRSNALITGLGAIHCVTKQEPEA